MSALPCWRKPTTERAPILTGWGRTVDNRTMSQRFVNCDQRNLTRLSPSCHLLQE